MAVIDPRLFELFETLVKARLDWLAFELIEGIQVGRALSESEEMLEAARASIRNQAKPKARGEPQPALKETQPIAVDEQVAWAVAYVEARLDDALAQLQASLDTIDVIVDGTVENPNTPEALTAGRRAAGRGTVSVLLDLEGERASDRDDVADARERFPALRLALAEWAVQARGQATI